MVSRGMKVDFNPITSKSAALAFQLGVEKMVYWYARQGTINYKKALKSYRGNAIAAIMRNKEICL